MTKKINVYDFDKTIYDGDSTIDFWKFCIRHYKKTLLALPGTLCKYVPYFFGMCNKTAFKETFFGFLKHVPDVNEAVTKFWEEHSANIKPWYLQQKSDSDLIISASPEFLLAPVCEKLGVRLIASKVDSLSGKFDGKNCHDTEKVQRFKALYPETEIQAFYSDSLSDLPMAKISKEPYIVSGDAVISWNEYKPTAVKKMKEMFLSKDFLLFIFCGGMGTLTNFICSLLISIFINPTVAYVFGYALSLFVAYALNARLIFKERLHVPQFLKFVVSYIPNFVILFAFVCVFLNIFGWNKVLVYALAALFGIPVTFVLVKLFAFGKKKSNEEK
ncbi:MAG TPA: HAD-IB family phosphatase [Methanocorpusculum sp.]|nr:HAD-IB family phosphatase [Methanocorpusculum sp.]